jgi:hypothetical protein
MKTVLFDLAFKYSIVPSVKIMMMIMLLCYFCLRRQVLYQSEVPYPKSNILKQDQDSIVLYQRD